MGFHLHRSKKFCYVLLTSNKRFPFVLSLLSTVSNYVILFARHKSTPVPLLLLFSLSAGHRISHNTLCITPHIVFFIAPFLCYSMYHAGNAISKCFFQRHYPITSAILLPLLPDSPCFSVTESFFHFLIWHSHTGNSPCSVQLSLVLSVSHDYYRRHTAAWQS